MVLMEFTVYNRKLIPTDPTVQHIHITYCYIGDSPHLNNWQCQDLKL